MYSRSYSCGGGEHSQQDLHKLQCDHLQQGFHGRQGHHVLQGLHRLQSLHRQQVYYGLNTDTLGIQGSSCFRCIQNHPAFISRNFLQNFCRHCITLPCDDNLKLGTNACTWNASLLDIQVGLFQKHWASKEVCGILLLYFKFHNGLFKKTSPLYYFTFSRRFQICNFY